VYSGPLAGLVVSGVGVPLRTMTTRANQIRERRECEWKSGVVQALPHNTLRLRAALLLGLVLWRGSFLLRNCIAPDEIPCGFHYRFAPVGASGEHPGVPPLRDGRGALPLVLPGVFEAR
jgi:hypothetical protein